MSKNKPTTSATHTQASAIAKGTQKPGQSKEQTKIIAAGIEKGIAQYKKLHKAKLREQDKLRKKRDKNNTVAVEVSELEPVAASNSNNWLPWLLLIISWLGFGAYNLLSSSV